MGKRILLSILFLMLLSCEGANMSGTKVNEYSNADLNIEATQDTVDKTFFGKIDAITLTELTTTTVPAISINSVVENNNTFYEFATEDAISTTDPVTTATVADGTVYVCLIPDLGNDEIDGAFTATAPTWSDTKKGWYGTGDQANYRYLPIKMTKAGALYSAKIFFPVNAILYYTFPAIEPTYTTGALVNASLSADDGGSSSYTDIVFNTEDLDIAANYNDTTGVFTAPRNGYYRFEVTLIFNFTANSTYVIDVRNYIDTSARHTYTRKEYRVNGTAESDQINLSDYVQLTAGETYKWAWQVSTGTASQVDLLAGARMLAKELYTNIPE